MDDQTVERVEAVGEAPLSEPFGYAQGRVET